MRSATWTRWATCALALSICVPLAAAQPTRTRSVATCTTFDQEDKDDETLSLKIHNTCSIPVDCTLSWRVVCAPESKKRRAVHKRSTNLTVTDGTTQTTDASAAVCGDDAWVIDSILWSCQPNKD